jgi:hypothetical protein
MDYNQIRDEGLAIHKTYMQDAAEWRQARVPANKTPTKLTSIKRPSLIWTTVINLLLGR